MFHGETHIGFGVPILRNHQIEGSKINLWQKVLDKIKRGDEPDYAHLHEFVSHPWKQNMFLPNKKRHVWKPMFMSAKQLFQF